MTARPGLVARFLGWTRARLQRRMVVTLAAVLIVLSAAFLVLIADLYRSRIAAEMERSALQINGLLHAALENAMLKRDLPGLRAIVADLGADEDIVAVRILNPDFEVRFASDLAQEGTTLDSALIRQAFASRQPLSEMLTSGIVRSVNPVLNQARCQVCHGPMTGHPVNGLLVVDYATAGLDGEARRTVALLSLAGLAVTGASLLASWIVVRRTVLRPLEDLADGTAALAAGRLDHRLAQTGTDEISLLADGFNQMAGRLQAAAQDLEAGRNTLQSVIDAIPDAIRVIGPDYRILIANDAYAAHVGASSPKQAVGQPCHLSTHGRDTPCVETLVCCPLAEARAGTLPLTCRQTHLCGANGEAVEIHVEVAAAPLMLMIGGQPVPCVVEAIRDLEQQARLSQEQRLSELGLLAAGLAHEIHNPMSSISLLLEVARSELAEGLVDEAGQRLDTIGQEVGRTLKITNSLLTLCLPPSPDPVLVDIDRVIPEALEILAYQAQEAGCTQGTDITPGLRFLGSESDLRMLVTNLMLNAFHAMPGGGNVVVEGRREGGEVVLRVRDQGIGIAAADLGRVFLPFWTRRADGSPGRGLGLSIVQAIVSRCNGRISVESAIGRGSTFTIRLPDPDAPLHRDPVDRQGMR